MKNLFNRRKSIPIKVGNITVGGESPICVQSMCKTKTTDIKSTLFQIEKLIQAGCELVRISIPDDSSILALKKIKQELAEKKKEIIPLIADIHFNYKLAIKAAEIADKIRINPGNIDSGLKLKEIIKAAKYNNIPIRIGVNAGSIEKQFCNLKNENALVKSMLKHITFFEKCNFQNLIISLKSSNVEETIKANREIAKRCHYPIHLGITEAGNEFSGTIKSVVGIGILLYEGIGDTIRVSLSADPVKEVKVGKEILIALGLKKSIDIVSCPTCARTNIDVVTISNKLESLIKNSKTGQKNKKNSNLKPVQNLKSKISNFRHSRLTDNSNFKISIMGCCVNGIGEASKADIGIVGIKPNWAYLYVSGEKKEKIPEETIIGKIKTIYNKLVDNF